MRKHPDGNLVALEFEALVLQKSFRSTSRTGKLYGIEGLPGIYRRVPVSSQQERPEHHLIAWFGGSAIELVPATKIEEELQEAGFLKQPVDVTRLPANVRKACLHGMFKPQEEQPEEQTEAVPDEVTEEEPAE
jgi:hypothetical protein